MNINSINQNWQTYLFYAVIVALTGAGAYLKLIDPSLFGAAIIGVIGNGLGQAQAKAALSAQTAAVLAAQNNGNAVVSAPAAPQNGNGATPAVQTTGNRG